MQTGPPQGFSRLFTSIPAFVLCDLANGGFLSIPSSIDANPRQKAVDFHIGTGRMNAPNYKQTKAF
jgi:hypothetical protein